MAANEMWLIGVAHVRIGRSCAGRQRERLKGGSRLEFAKTFTPCDPYVHQQQGVHETHPTRKQNVAEESVTGVSCVACAAVVDKPRVLHFGLEGPLVSSVFPVTMLRGVVLFLPVRWFAG